LLFEIEFSSFVYFWTAREKTGLLIFGGPQLNIVTCNKAKAGTITVKACSANLGGLNLYFTGEFEKYFLLIYRSE
jgi:hypothetical protein